MKAKAVGTSETRTALEQEREETLDGIEDTSSVIEPLFVTTTRTFVKGGHELATEEKAETIKVRDFLVPPARVGVEIGQTVNMGNYESLRITVNAQIPCHTEEMAEAYDHVVAFARDRIVAERSAAAEWAKKKAVENLF